jgi:hypothetical protein
MRVVMLAQSYNRPRLLHACLSPKALFNLQMEGATSDVVCRPCVDEEGSAAGAVECWPRVVSAVASNPPPLTPGLSDGDIVTFTFSKATNQPSGTGNGGL